MQTERPENWNESKCVEASPAKDFETMIYALQELCSHEEVRYEGLLKLKNKLIGQDQNKEPQVSTTNANISVESFQGLFQECLERLRRSGNKIDSILERLHDKI